MNIREMGLVHAVEIEGGEVTIRISLPCTGCPAHSLIRSDVIEHVSRVDGVDTVSVITDWEDPWTTARVDVAGARRARPVGIVV